MKRSTLVMASLFILMLVLVIGRSVVSNTISPNGTILAEIEKEKEFYKKQNKILREELFAKASLNRISSEAARLGFVERKESFRLTKPLPLAKR